MPLPLLTWTARAAAKIVRLSRKALGNSRVRLGIAVVLFVGWLGVANDVLSEQDPRAALSASVERLAARDPVVRDIIHNITNQSELDSLGITAQAAFESQSPVDTIATLVGEMRARGELPRTVVADSWTLEDLTEWSAEDREGFMTGYAALFGFLDRAGLQEAADAALETLQELRSNPGVWSKLRLDPLGLVIANIVGDQELVKTYLENASWLQTAIESLPLSDGESCREELVAALAAVKAFPEEAKTLAVEEEAGGLGLSVLARYPELLALTSRAYGIPLEEVATVLFFNTDCIALLGANDQDRAAKLAFIRKEEPSVWSAAQLRPLYLRMYLKAPSVASQVIGEYGHTDVGSLIYSCFGDLPAEELAIHAVAKYGEVAMLVFTKWGHPDQLERTASYLMDPDLGIRAVPFIIKYQDAAFDKIADDKAWVDRYFLPNGDPRQDMDWLGDVPLVGSIALVGNNWAHGYPSDASEIGWAVLDAGDLALTAFTFGSSKLVTSGAKAAAKQAAKAGAKEVAKDIAEEGVEVMAKKGFKSAVRRNVENLLARQGKSAIESAAESRASWRKLLHAKGSKRGLRATLAELRTGTKAGLKAALHSGLYVGGRLSQGVVIGSLRVAEGGAGAWKRLSPLGRRVVTGAFLGATLIAKLTIKTIPHLPEIGRGIGNYAGEVIADLSLAVTEGTVTATQSFVDKLTGSLSLSILFSRIAVTVLLGLFFLKELAPLILSLLHRSRKATHLS